MLKEQGKAKERRKRNRNHCWLPATFSIVSGQDSSKKPTPLPAVVEELSPTGLRMRVRSIEADGLHICGQRTKTGWIGNKLVIDFFSPTNKPVRVRVTGIPTWYKRERLSGEFSIGVSVEQVGISEKERKKLMRLLRG